MHIAFLTPEYPDSQRPAGGLANYIRKVAVELLARGNEVTVFVLSSENKTWNDQGINVIQFKSFRFNWRLRRMNSLSPKLSLIEQWVNSKNRERFSVKRESKEWEELYTGLIQ